jgi:hypothetical protein
MKSKFLKTLFLSLVILASCKTNKNTVTNEYVNLFPIGKNGKWGYANEDGNQVIDYKFEKVSFYRGGRAAAKLNGKFGFINMDGAFIEKPKYDSIGYFTAHEASVVKKGKVIAIDRNGKKLKEGFIIATEGNAMENAEPLDYFDLQGGRYVLNKKDFKNEQRLDPKAELDMWDFTFDKVLPFSWNSFIVRKDKSYDIYLLNSGGLKDLQLDNIKPIRYQWNNAISSQYAKFEIDGKWGIISSTGNILIDPEFYSIENASGQYYLVEYKPDRWGYISQAKRMFKD